MKIETAFDIGEKVYFLAGSLGVLKGIIKEIKITAKGTYYNVLVNLDYKEVEENKVSLDKDELLLTHLEKKQIDLAEELKTIKDSISEIKNNKEEAKKKKEN